ncbi:MAG TPA: glycosyltransferase family 39 protein [Candidatus Limnocylindria bacterium]|nr:glycosyltransferase family 39 protein [Candidatus Limnocylindria bacterium]
MSAEAVAVPWSGARRLRGETIALAALLGGSALLFLWNLGASGWANSYYSAAALAGSHNWQAFLFGSFDAGNAITVDKTPASLWVMSLAVRLFGLNSWSVLVPQAIEGVAAVALLYLSVRREAGVLAGVVAGTVLALTPVAALMFRFNNPDALLTLLLVAAAHATVRSLDRGSLRWLAVAGVCIGLAFLTKMLEGLMIVPVLVAVYLVAAPGTMRRRLAGVGVAALATVVSAGWWLALVILWPATGRPYIGGSQSNSILDLMLGYNGLGRLTGSEVGRVGGGGPFGDGAGWLRLFGGELGSNVSWLVPAALIALGALLWLTRRRPRTSRMRAQALLWGGWLLVAGLLFSLMEGIFHAYYAVALVPPIGALVGLGAGAAWTRRRRAAARAGVAAAVAVSVAWAVALLARSPGWNPWLAPSVVALGVAGVLGTIFFSGARRIAQRGALAAAIGALLLAPAVGAVATAAQPHSGAIPSSAPLAEDRSTFGARGPFGRHLGAPGLVRGRPPSSVIAPPPAFRGFTFRGSGSFGNGGIGLALGGLLYAGTVEPELVAALQANAGAYRWVAATTGANNAAGLALASGESVMAIGGFNGTDPSPTLAQFQHAVARGEIHFYIAGPAAAGFPGAQGGSNDAAQISRWVTGSFTARTVGGVAVYDLTTG